VSTERFDIVVATKGAKEASGDIRKIGAEARNAAPAISQLRSLIEAIVSVQTLKEILTLADTYTKIQNQVRLATTSIEQFVAVQQRLFDISTKTHSSVQKNAELFNDLQQATEGLGISYDDLLDAQEAVNNAILIGGGNYEQGAAAFNSFILKLQDGTASSRDFKVIQQQVADLLPALAKQLGQTPADFLVGLDKGKLGLQEFVSALKGAGADLQAQADQVKTTFSGAFEDLRTQAIKFFGELNQKTGFADSLVAGIELVASHFELFVRGAGLLAITYFATQLPRAIRAVQVVFNTAFLSNPFGLMLVAITAVVAALTLFRNEIVLDSEKGTTLGDVMVVAFKRVAPYIAAIVQGLTDLAVGIATCVEKLKLFEKVGAVFSYVKDRVVDAAATVQGLGSIISDVANGEDIQTIGKNYLATSKAVHEGAQIVEEDLQKQLDLTTLLREEAEKPARTKDDTNPLAAPNGTGGKPPIDLAAAAKAAQAMETLLGKVLPVRQAVIDYSKDMGILNSALAQGKITQDEFNLAVSNLNEQTKQARNPLAAINAELDRQTQLLGLTNKERETQNQLFEIETQLRQAGVVLSAQERADLETKLTQLRELNEMMDRQDGILKEIRGPSEEYNKDVAALNELFAKGKITGEEHTAMLRDKRLAFLQTQTDLASGWERGILNLQKGYTDTASQIEGLLTNTFSKAEDTLTEFFTTGKADFKSLADSIINDITRIVVKQALLAPLMSMLGGGGGEGGGGGFLSGLFGGGGGGGFLSDLFGGGGGGGFLSGLFGFANGGDFDVGGSGGTDSQVVAFKASPGERVSVRRPDDRGGDGAVQVNATFIVQGATDARSFMESQDQLAANAAVALQRAMKRNK